MLLPDNVKARDLNWTLSVLATRGDLINGFPTPSKNCDRCDKLLLFFHIIPYKYLHFLENLINGIIN